MYVGCNIENHICVYDDWRQHLFQVLARWFVYVYLFLIDIWSPNDQSHSWRECHWRREYLEWVKIIWDHNTRSAQKSPLPHKTCMVQLRNPWCNTKLSSLLDTKMLYTACISCHCHYQTPLLIAFMFPVLFIINSSFALKNMLGTEMKTKLYHDVCHNTHIATFTEFISNWFHWQLPYIQFFSAFWLHSIK